MALQSFYRNLLLLTLAAGAPAALAEPAGPGQGEERLIDGSVTIDVSEPAVRDVNSLVDAGAAWPGAATQHVDDAVRTGATVRGVASTVPEPRAWALLLAGLALVASRRRAPSADLPFR